MELLDGNLETIDERSELRVDFLDEAVSGVLNPGVESLLVGLGLSLEVVQDLVGGNLERVGVTSLDDVQT